MLFIGCYFFIPTAMDTNKCVIMTKILTAQLGLGDKLSDFFYIDPTPFQQGVGSTFIILPGSESSPLI